jgi:hypothetical protein
MTVETVYTPLFLQDIRFEERTTTNTTWRDHQRISAGCIINNMSDKRATIPDIAALQKMNFYHMFLFSCIAAICAEQFQDPLGFRSHILASLSIHYRHVFLHLQSQANRPPLWFL